MFEIVKDYYNKQIYTDANVATFVRAGKITVEQYEQITGQPYVEQAAVLHGKDDDNVLYTQSL